MHGAQPWCTRRGGVCEHVCMGSCEHVQLCESSWETHTTARRSARRSAAAGVSGVPIPGLPSRLGLSHGRLCLPSTQPRLRSCLLPLAPSALLLPLAPNVLPCHLRHSIIGSQPGPALPLGCSQSSSRHGWAEPDNYTQLEEAQMRIRLQAARTLRAGQEGSGRHRHAHAQASAVAAGGNH